MLYRLHKNGYQAFLVGGGIRDLLIGVSPKDFDVATNARPEQIQALFTNCRLIGRRFRLAHVHFGHEIIEVTTFRAPHTSAASKSETGMLLRDNVYGTLEEDVLRRDFTCNALYYDIADFSIVDFVGGMDDLTAKRLTLIGEPNTRYREDPVRMLRAIRFAAKLDFTITEAAKAPIFELAPLLAQVPAARLFEEYGKLFLKGKALPTLKLLQQFNIFDILFPQTAAYLQADPEPYVAALIENAMANTDQRVADSKPVAPGFLIAILLWGPVQAQMQQQCQAGLPPFPALLAAMDEVLAAQHKVMAIPRRFVAMIRETWQLQLRLQRRGGRRAAQLHGLARFRAGFDFLLLRAQAGEPEAVPLAQWWQSYQDAGEKARWNMAKEVQSEARRNKKKSRKPKAKDTEKPSDAEQTAVEE